MHIATAPLSTSIFQPKKNQQFISAISAKESPDVDYGTLQIGRWPRSRAIYGIDVLLVRGPSWKCSPQLLEVNFCPDFTTLLKVGSKEAIDDFMLACFTSEPVSEERFRRLKHDLDLEETVPGLKELNALD
jgi:hypothetical protein